MSALAHRAGIDGISRFKAQNCPVGGANEVAASVTALWARAAEASWSIAARWAGRSAVSAHEARICWRHGRPSSETYLTRRCALP
jgi:hypothetical protein